MSPSVFRARKAELRHFLGEYHEIPVRKIALQGPVLPVRASQAVFCGLRAEKMPLLASLRLR